MKKNYFLKGALLSAAIFGATTVFAQTPTATTLTEIKTPVVTADGTQDFDFVYQASAAWGDYNNDGYLDLLATGLGTRVKVDENGEPIPGEDGSPQKEGYRKTILYKNNAGDGTFTIVPTEFPRIDVGAVAWLDYDNDGNLDVFLMGNIEGGAYSGLWKNLGQSEDYQFEDAFPAEFEYFRLDGANNSSHAIAVGDYNNDGWVDIAFTGWSNENGRVTYLYRNVDAIYFTKVEYPVNGTKPFIQMDGGTLAWGDYNNDGYLDLLAAGYVQNNDEYKLHYSQELIADGRGTNDEGDLLTCGIGIVYTNNGDGTFSDPADSFRFPYGEDGEASWADYNNDGYLDFLVIGYTWWKDTSGNSYDWNIGLFENDHEGSFIRHSLSEAGFSNYLQSTTVTWGDVNNDGFTDVVLGKENAAIYYNNYGDGTVTKYSILYGDELEARNYRGGTFNLVDFDNDNDLDIFANGYDDRDMNRLVKNDLGDGISANAAPTVPTNLQTETNDGVTTFSWNASTDDLESSVTYNLYVKQENQIISVLPADLTTGRLKVNDQLAPLTTAFYKLNGLEGDYEWGVQAIDNAKNASAFAKVGGSGIAVVNPNAVTILNAVKAIKVKAAAGVSGTITIYNVAGAQVYSKAGEINGTTVELSAGVYVVKVTSAEGVVAAKAIVK